MFSSHFSLLERSIFQWHPCLPLPVWGGALNAPEWRPRRQRIQWGFVFFAVFDSVLKLVECQDSEYLSLPPPDPTWPAAGPDWTGLRWEKLQRSHSSPNSEKHISWFFWHYYWSCLEKTYKKYHSFLLIIAAFSSSYDDTFHRYPPDITWLVEWHLRVEDLRNQDWWFLLAFLWLLLSGPNTLDSDCGIESYKKVEWVDTWLTDDFFLLLFYSFLWGSSSFHPTCLVWCCAWSTGGYWNIISVYLVRVGMMDFLLLYRSTPRLCLHFS